MYLTLVILAILFFAFLAYAPEVALQTLLAGVWLLMIVAGVGSIAWEIVKRL